MAFLGKFTEADASASSIATPTRTTTSGSLIVCGGSTWSSGAGKTLVLSSNQAGTYTEDLENTVGSSGDIATIALAHNIGGTRGAGHTVTNTVSGGAGASAAVSAAEFDGVDAVPTVTVGTAATATSTAPSCSVTVPSGNATVVAIVTYIGASTTITPSNGTEATEADENSDNQAHAMAYKVGASGTVTIAWTLGASRAWVCRAVAFSEPSVGGGTTRGTPFGHRGTAFNGGRAMQGPLMQRESLMAA